MTLKEIGRPAQINEMIVGVERYNPENLPELEQYLGLQCRNETYDPIANSAILELYQFNPQLINIAVVNTILAKSLTALPDADFAMYLCYLNPNILNEASVRSLLDLQRLLEECRYVDFWKTLAKKEYSELLEDVKGFHRDIRQVISNALKLTFDRISKNIISDYLDLKGEELEKYIQTNGWTINGEDILFDKVKEAKSQSSAPLTHQIKLEQLSKVIALANDE